MAATIEIAKIEIESRSERKEDRASLFTGVATAQMTGPSGTLDIDVKFANAIGLDGGWPSGRARSRGSLRTRPELHRELAVRAPV